MTTAAKISKVDFFGWLDFFRGARVVIGSGRTSWELAGGWFANEQGQAYVRLVREVPEIAGCRKVTTTVAAERIRAAK